MQPVKILVLRFSAMGDVALAVPAVRSLVQQYPQVEVTVVTRPKFAPFFYDLERVTVFAADVDYTYNGIFGMRDLFKALIRKSSWDVVIDLHDHLRTKLLRFFFRLFFVDVVVFDKGRKEKKAFSRKRNKVIRHLPHTVERYRAAFEKAGFPFELLPPPWIEVTAKIRNTASAWLAEKQLVKGETWIGLAPFAMHATKIWPLENYTALIDSVLERMPARFFLFGGGDREISYFEGLRKKYPGHCVIAAGALKIRQEIALMEHLDLMICVDSANMHLASLAGVPVLAIFGGTHPEVGFAPLGNNASVIQIAREELPCRPCSVYGRERCYVGGFPCLTRITPSMVADQVFFKTRISGTNQPSDL